MWVSDNESVATVSDGVITGVGAGSAEITVYTESRLASKTIKVTVVDGRHLFSLNVGSLYLKYAIVNPEDITEYDLSYTALLDNSADDGSVVWTSDDESVATVSASGKINKVGIGTTKVHGVYTFSDGVSRTAYVNVYVAKSVVNINIGDIGLEEENFEITSAMLKGFDLSTADVTFDGADIDAEITADKITFAVENFGVTDFVSGLITVTTEEAVFKCETFFVTRVIKTKQDLVDFFDFTERLTLNFNETVYNVSGYTLLKGFTDLIVSEYCARLLTWIEERFTTTFFATKKQIHGMQSNVNYFVSLFKKCTMIIDKFSVPERLRQF